VGEEVAMNKFRFTEAKITRPDGTEFTGGSVSVVFDRLPAAVIDMCWMGLATYGFGGSDNPLKLSRRSRRRWRGRHGRL
jgi:hypothetical protein